MKAGLAPGFLLNSAKKNGAKRMSLNNQFKTNKTAEIEGVWVEYAPNNDGTVPAFKIARASKTNKKYQKTLNKKIKPYSKALELGTMDEKLAQKLYTEVFIDSLLIDWRNVKVSDISDDEQAEGFADFTQSNAIELFDKLPDLYDDLEANSKKLSMFRDDELEDDLGN